MTTDLMEVRVAFAAFRGIGKELIDQMTYEIEDLRKVRDAAAALLDLIDHNEAPATQAALRNALRAAIAFAAA